MGRSRDWMLLAIVAIHAVAAEDNNVDTVEVVGAASVRVPADETELRLTITSTAATVAAARNQTAKALQDVLRVVLNTNDIPEANVSTAALRIQANEPPPFPPQMYGPDPRDPRTGGPVEKRFSVESELLIRTGWEKIGMLIDTATAAGGNALRVEGPYWHISNGTHVAAKTEARKQAAQKAQFQADLLASQFGSRLGKVLRISETPPCGSSPPRPMFERVGAPSDSGARTAVLPTDVEVHAMVYATFALISE